MEFITVDYTNPLKKAGIFLDQYLPTCESWSLKIIVGIFQAYSCHLYFIPITKSKSFGKNKQEWADISAHVSMLEQMIRSQ